MNYHAVRVIQFSAFVCFIFLFGCSDNDVNPVTVIDDTLVTELSVSPDLVALGDELTVTITWKNNTSELVVFFFDSTKLNDFEIMGIDEPLGSHSADYLPVSGEARVAAGGELKKSYRFILNPTTPSDNVQWANPLRPLATGDYSVTGGIVGYSEEMPWDSAIFRVVE